jgi:perosamine synthetase
MLPQYIEKKLAIASRYRAGLKAPGITLMPEAPWAKSIFWLYTILVDEEQFGMSARGVLKELEMRGVQTRPLWQPMHRSPAHINCEAFQCEIADFLYARALSLPCSVGLAEADQDFVIESLLNLAAAR